MNSGPVPGDPPSPDRWRAADELRAAAILGVVAIHATSPILNEAAAGGAFPIWPLLLNQAARFSVPAFFVLAGFFTAVHAPASPGGLRRRLARLVLPYLTWSVILAVLPPLLHGDSAPADLPRRLLFGWTFTGAYFLMALIQLTLIAPLLVRLAGRGGRAGWIFCGLAALAVTAAHYLVAPERLSLFLSTFVAWLPFFLAGILVGVERDRWVARLGRARVAAAVAVPVLIVLEVVESQRILAITGSPGAAAGFLKISSVCYAAAVIVVVLGRSGLRADTAGAPARFARRIADHLAGTSYAIFLIHGAVILKLLDAGPLWWQVALDSPAGPILLMAPAVALPWAMHAACRRFLPSPVMLWLFGGGTASPRRSPWTS